MISYLMKLSTKISMHSYFKANGKLRTDPWWFSWWCPGMIFRRARF